MLPSVLDAPVASSAQSLFFDLFPAAPSEEVRARAHRFLELQLEGASQLQTDVPCEMNDLEAWMLSSVEEVGHRYRAYLDERQNGGPRRYFPTKASALGFLKNAAPTKLVDGAWLYGLLDHWQDPRFGALIKTYLEELGEGLPTKNHVVLYRKLLASQGLEHLLHDLPDDNYVQGAIQLSLAYSADRFLPEIIGFNLGYEQLPLHLLICAYELKELGIDPYYFTLHITVDNADSGHARQAVDAVFAARPRVGDGEDFWRRVRNGYNLNFLGASTNSVIDDFSLDHEMTAIFARKGAVGQYAHSDYRRVEGRTVNEWLSRPELVSEFTHAMEREGWFQRHQDPANSRFWRLIHSEKAKMFGVFNAYEQQVIYDWIAGDAPREGFERQSAPGALTFEQKQRLRHTPGLLLDGDTDFDEEVRALEHKLAGAINQQQTMQTLIELMSPALHHSAAGLKATRIFNDVLG